MSDNLRSMEHLQSYFATLGRMMHEFGQTESHLAFMIHRYASQLINEAYEPAFAPHIGMVRPSPLMEVLKALMGVQRSAVMSEILKELMRAAGRDEQSRREMKDTLDQLGHIRAIRDRIIHNGAWPEKESGRWRSSTTQGRRPKDLKTAYFTVDDLLSASRDLAAIRQRISALLITENPNARKDAESSGAFGPWQYKPVQLDANGR